MLLKMKKAVDAVYRKFKMPLRAVIQRFGADKISAKNAEDGRRKPYEMITLLHAVYTRDERDITRVDAGNKPVASVYIDPENKTILSEGGFDEFCYCVPRF